MKRYFIIFYRADNQARYSTGWIPLYTTDGTYFNHKMVKNAIINRLIGFTIDEIIIINIIELNEVDYYQFIKE